MSNCCKDGNCQGCKAKRIKFDRMMRKINGEELYEYEKLEKLKQALKEKR
jgi:hypothetical protein